MSAFMFSNVKKLYGAEAGLQGNFNASESFGMSA